MVAVFVRDEVACKITNALSKAIAYPDVLYLHLWNNLH
jgi:hypothetical protein